MRRMYSENQLKEVVIKGIESGEIPSGGTQLYLHNYHNESNNYVIMFITDTSQELNAEQFYNKLIIGKILNCLVYNDDGLGLWCIPVSNFRYNGNTFEFICVGTSGAESDQISFDNKTKDIISL